MTDLKVQVVKQQAAKLADRLIKEGKLNPKDRARIIRMCNSNASYQAAADYYGVRHG